MKKQEKPQYFMTSKNRTTANEHNLQRCRYLDRIGKILESLLPNNDERSFHKFTKNVQNKKQNYWQRQERKTRETRSNQRNMGEYINILITLSWNLFQKSKLLFPESDKHKYAVKLYITYGIIFVLLCHIKIQRGVRAIAQHLGCFLIHGQLFDSQHSVWFHKHHQE